MKHYTVLYFDQDEQEIQADIPGSPWRELLNLHNERIEKLNDVFLHHLTPKVEIQEVPYPYGGTALFDGEHYYNSSGQLLRDPSEYNQYSEGYTPFGDE